MSTDKCQPLMYIQCDWNECLKSRDKEAWISYKFRGEPSVTGKLQLFDGKISCTNGFEVVAYHGQSVTLKHSASEVTTVFLAPSSIFSIHDKSCAKIAVTSGGLGLSAGSEAELYVWDVQRGVIRRTLEGHFGDLYRCRWFPSGVVALAGGADCRIRIWCAQTGQCPVTLTGHTGPVTDLAVVDRGKNIITTSKDGTARLWHVGESRCLGILCELQATGITCCVLTSSNQLELPLAEESLSEKEIGTEEKVLAAGAEDGTLLLIGVRARAEMAKRILSSSVTAITLVNNETLAIGLEDGQIHLISILSSNLVTSKIIHESYSSVKSLLGINEQLLLAGLGDGCCVGYGVHSLIKNTTSSRIQLTGSDFEPINDLAWDGQNYVYTASRDGCVRKYQVGELIEKLYSRFKIVTT